MDPQSDPLPDATIRREALEIENLRLTGEKIRRELLDLRRPYLFRNSQLLTALITSIGAIVGLSILISEDYFKAVLARNQLLELQAKEAMVEATKNGSAADAKKAEADAKMVEADALAAKANRAMAAANASKIKADAKQHEAEGDIQKYQQQVEAARRQLTTMSSRSKEVQEKLRAANDLEKAAHDAFAIIVNARAYLEVKDWNHFDRQWSYVRTNLNVVKRFDPSKLAKIGSDSLTNLWEQIRDDDKELAALEQFRAARNVKETLRKLDDLSNYVEKLATDSHTEFNRLSGQLSAIAAQIPN
jgi:chromosome segregation ATPase